MGQTRLITKYSEVLSLIEKIFLNHQPLDIAQKVGEQVIFSKGEIKNVNPNSNDFTVRPVDKNRPFQFIRNEELSIKNFSRSISFTSTPITLCKPHIMNIRIPEELFLTNSRRSFRYSVVGREISVTLINRTRVNLGQDNIFSASLLDISETGLGLKISPESASCFSANDLIQLKSINKNRIDHLNGKIIHCHPESSFKDDLWYKLGIRFIDSINLNPILQDLEDCLEKSDAPFNP